MTQLRWDVAAAASLAPADLTKLIRKLRWIGMEEEASKLQRAIQARPDIQPAVTSLRD